MCWHEAKKPFFFSFPISVCVTVQAKGFATEFLLTQEETFPYD